jgi:hypothetical protein
MACQSGIESCLHGFSRTDLSDDDHIGIFTQSKAQCLLKGARMGISDLTLIDHGLHTGVQILRGILDHKDMFEKIPVDVIDHGAQSRGLAASGGACDKDQAPFRRTDLFQKGGQRSICKVNAAAVTQRTYSHTGAVDGGEKVDAAPSFF